MVKYINKTKEKWKKLTKSEKIIVLCIIYLIIILVFGIYFGFFSQYQQEHMIEQFADSSWRVVK
jgi:cell division protein FtsL